MQIVGVATEIQCKICRSDNREAIEGWILRRALKQKDEQGVRIDMKYVKARMGELGIVYPRDDNVDTHLRKHCQIVEDDDVALLDRIAEDLGREVVALGAQFDAQGPANADTLPDRVIAIYDLQMRAELRQGKVPRITPDQVRAMIDTKTRRRQNERLTDLLDIHAAALSGAVGWDSAIDAAPDEYAEIVEESKEPLSKRLIRVIQWHEDVEGGTVDENLIQLLRECLWVVSQYENMLPVKP